MQVRPKMLDISGGFPWLAAAPFITAATIPVLNSAGKWVGKKIFGHGLVRAGERIPRGMGLADNIAKAAVHPIPKGPIAHYRAGDIPMPKLMRLHHHIRKNA